ncbi:hypothetical protein GE253_20200 [Niveispirillum sp. SYP-B3756]|uniref:hypothetical protein n=1 Tax=Niveispirillum sp. SYP-B3756 TaxID=2662178 RepID=UPI0012927215|nr:hypothetical protein [Niveispirillum sp. SYP-B3756]MQP67654.1 hypothetical protein [Niveispirillum sp. SYP-B3756]
MMIRFTRFLIISAALVAVPSAALAQSTAESVASTQASPDMQVAQAGKKEHKATGSAAGNRASVFSAGRLYPALGVAGVAVVGALAATLGGGDDEAGPPTSTSTSTSTATSTR